MSAKRTKAQREHDLHITARLYVQGYTVSEITASLNEGKEDALKLAARTIYNDLKEIRKRWLESSIRDFDEMKAQELARLDAVEAEAWRAWEASKKPKTETERDETTNKAAPKRDDDMRETHQKVRVRAKKTERDPSTQYLELVLDCIDKRCKILGFDAPKKVAHELSWREEAIAHGLDPEVEVTHLEQQFIEAARRARKDGG